jgi:hypothetical protein
VEDGDTGNYLLDLLPDDHERKENITKNETRILSLKRVLFLLNGGMKEEIAVGLT